MTFVDTNILLYAISTQPKEADKTQKAKAILSDPDLNPGQNYNTVRVINPFSKN